MSFLHVVINLQSVCNVRLVIFFFFTFKAIRKDKEFINIPNYLIRLMAILGACISAVKTEVSTGSLIWFIYNFESMCINYSLAVIFVSLHIYFCIHFHVSIDFFLFYQCEICFRFSGHPRWNIWVFEKNCQGFELFVLCLLYYRGQKWVIVDDLLA